MKEYTSPSVTELGSVADLTLGGRNRRFLDASFPTGTPLDQLTTS